VIAEATFLVLLLFFVELMIHNPRSPLTHGDDGLDSALLNAIARSDWFPPFDPWFSGYPLNYYYLGHLGQSLLARISAIPTPVAYSISMASVMALTTSICLATGWAMTGRWWGGLFAAVAVGLATNLDLVVQAVAERRLIGLDWFRSAWLIKDVLTAPPYVTFTFGELHAQFLALAALATALGLMHALVTMPRSTLVPGQRWVYLCIAGLAVGMPGMTNIYSWPVPIAAWGLLYGCLWLWYRARWVVVDGATGLIVSVVAYLPFFLTYHGNSQAKVIANPLFTPAPALLLLFGMFLVPLMCWAFVDSLRSKAPDAATPPRHWLEAVVTIFLALALAAVMTIGGFPRLGLFLYLAAFLICLGRGIAVADSRRSLPELVAWVMASASFGVLLLIEVVSVDVPTTTVNMRFNIAWKTYLSVWIPLALASALATFALWHWEGGRALRLFCRCAATVAVVPVVLGGMAGVLHTLSYMNFMREKPGLDGLGYVQTSPQAYRNDFLAIDWLNQHAEDSDVVLETAGGARHPNGRISSYTGLATVLGWEHAVDAWQGFPPTLKERRDDVAHIYTNANASRTRQLLAKYRVRYIAIGGLEESTYVTLDRAGLEAIAPVVFRAGNTVILRVPDEIVFAGT
jgi:YYY domain-containing protein